MTKFVIANSGLIVGLFFSSSRFDDPEQPVGLVTDSGRELELTIKKE